MFSSKKRKKKRTSSYYFYFLPIELIACLHASLLLLLFSLQQNDVLPNNKIHDIEVYLSDACFSSSETWWHHCSTRWGLVTIRISNNYMISLPCPFRPNFEGSEQLIIWIMNLFSYLMFVTKLFELFVACSPNQHMKRFHRSFIKLLRIINVLASRSCHPLTSLYVIMPVM